MNFKMTLIVRALALPAIAALAHAAQPKALARDGGDFSEAPQPLRDVTPVGGLGTLRFEGVESLGATRIQVTDEALRTVVLPAAPLLTDLSLKPGRYCISIFGLLSMSRCGYDIVAKKKLTVPLSLVTMTWNDAVALTDVGPQLGFVLQDKEGNSGGTGVPPTDKPFATLSARNSASTIRDKPIVLFSGAMRLTWNVDALADESRDLIVPARASATFDLTPPDERATVRVVVNPARFPQPDIKAYRHFSNYASLGFLARRPTPQAQLNGGFARTTLAGTSFASSGAWIGLDLPAAGKTHEVKVWPLGASAGESLLALVVNDILIPFEPFARQTVELNIETLNVEHVNGNQPGCYKLHQLLPFGDGTVEKRTFTTFVVADNASLLRNGSEFCYSTRTTMYVPTGWTYRVSSFLADASGRLVPQSEEDVDLGNQ
jgi:hypothetical protein